MGSCFSVQFSLDDETLIRIYSFLRGIINRNSHEVEEMPTQPTVGQEEMLSKAWNHLMKDEVGIMGLHGMGGVGKTTLFKKINNKFAEIAGRFDIVIWVVVSQGAKISKLQEDIAEKLQEGISKLNLCNDVWKNKRESDKAYDIYRVLRGKRFVLMLDDIWEKVDLQAIGVPCPTKENGCKVAFTTRSRDVCEWMGDHEPVEVKCLEWNKAWELFQNKVGDKILSPDIVEQAKTVAKKCCGLPLALNVIGETMAPKTMVQEWDHAIDELTRSAAEFSNMDNKILPILKYSYESLEDEHVKSCFLYCALFPEDGKIDKKNLIDYWMCEGFFGEYQVIKRAMNKGYGVLGTLIRSHLVMEAANTHLVVMHDVVREMALWIASDFGKQKETFIVQARVELRKIPEVKDWGAVRMMSLMSNDIEEINCASNCSELTTLFLQSNKKLKNLSGEFIRSMQKLVVLDLSDNHSLDKLPEQISELASLQFLNLKSTSIEQLPVGFQELKKLTHLNLTHTWRLCSISGMSKLSSLRVLKLRDSNVDVDVSLVKELQLLEDLQVLTITISTELGLKQLSDDQRLANCITRLDINDIQQKPLLVIMVNLRHLRVRNSHVWEINTDIKCRESETNISDLQNPTRPCFRNLSRVFIDECNGIKDLTWLLFAPNLVNLVVHKSDDVEEIINKEKATNLTDITPFQKLESLRLSKLPKLESIYWSPLPFPFLKQISAIECPKLRNLSSVDISECNGIKDLTWLLFAPNLVSLSIGYSDDVEEIINKEKATNLTDITPFLKLETLILNRLPKLESIYWSPLPFPFLKQITAIKCPKLRKLPLNATSVPRLGVWKFGIVVFPDEIELEWEDEDTKNRFLPFLFY